MNSFTFRRSSKRFEIFGVWSTKKDGCHFGSHLFYWQDENRRFEPTQQPSAMGARFHCRGARRKSRCARRLSPASATKQLKVSQLRLTFNCFSAPAALLRSCLVLSGALPLMYPAALCPLRLRSAQTGTGGSPDGSWMHCLLLFGKGLWRFRARSPA